MTRFSIDRALLLAPLYENRARSIIAVLAIALGVALGYAVQLINHMALGEFSHALAALSGSADLEVRGPRSGFDEELYARIARMSEVAVASPVIELDVRLPELDGRRPELDGRRPELDGRRPERRESLKIIGLDIFRAARVQPDLVSAQGAEGLDYLRPDRMFLSRAAADWLARRVGDELTIQVGLEAKTFRIAGILSGDSLSEPLGVIDIGAAQAALAWLGRINVVDIRLRGGVDVEAFARRLHASLPPGLLVERPRDNIERNASLSRSYRVNLNVLALVALLTGGLLVFSTQALAVVRRRSQLALLLEALLVGAVGALLGIVIGQVCADLIISRVGVDLGAGQFRGLRASGHAEPWAVALFMFLGIAVAMVGSLVPALEAARAQPAHALKAGDERQAFVRLGSAWPGLASLAAGAALTQAGPVGGLPIFGYVAIALLLFGTIMLMPRVAAICFGALPAMRAVPARLAVSQLAGAPGQASVSLAAIVAGVSLMVSMAIMVTSFRQSLQSWLEHVLPADLYVRTGLQNEAAFISPQDQARIRSVPGVRLVEFMRAQQIQLAPGQPRVLLMARVVDRSNPGDRLAVIGPQITVSSGAPPPVWISEAIADLYHYRLGDIVSLPLAGRPAPFTVAGLWRDYARQQGSLVIERDQYAALTGDASANDGGVWLDPGAKSQDVAAAITRSVTGGSRLEIHQAGEVRSMSLSLFDRTFAVTYALEAAAVLIGLVGLSSAFGALVLSRRREFGMLRHIGMTRSQIGAMLATEGGLVSSLGLASGFALGLAISMVLIHVVNRQSFHWSMELHLPWTALGVFALVMLALSTLTALASGRRAMSEDAVRAVKDDW